jgi:hypothetical protein
VLSYPLVIAAGGFLPVPVRFQPTSFGSMSATITVISDDPAGPRSILVSGRAPSGTLAVTGSTCFGGVCAGRCAERTLSICNVGACNLRVTNVSFRKKSRYWKLIHNPFPATLRPGSCLGLLVRYRACERCPRCCELVIECDDPNTPVKTLELTAYTIWTDCACKQGCEDCKRGCCGKHSSGCCCGGCTAPCCDDEDGDEEEP